MIFIILTFTKRLLQAERDALESELYIYITKEFLCLKRLFLNGMN